MESPEEIDNFYFTLPATFAIIGNLHFFYSQRLYFYFNLFILGSSKTGKTHLFYRILSELDRVAPNSLPIAKFVLVVRYNHSIFLKK